MAAEIAASALVSASTDQQPVTLQTEVQAEGVEASPIPLLLMQTSQNDVMLSPVVAVPVEYSFTYALCGVALVGPVSRYPGKTYFEITNRPEQLPGARGMGLHNFRVRIKEAGTLFANHAGVCFTSSARSMGGPMPFFWTTTFNNKVHEFLASLPPPSFNGERCLVTKAYWQNAVASFPEPEQSVAWHLSRGYQGCFGQSFVNFRPTPFLQRDPTIRPDLAYHCQSFLRILVGAISKQALYFINFLAVDVREPWDTYETDTGLPRQEMIGGEWWMRMKVCSHTRGSRVSGSLAARHPPDSRSSIVL